MCPLHQMGKIIDEPFATSGTYESILG